MTANTKLALKSLLILGVVGGGIYLITLRTRHQQAWQSGALAASDREACGLDRECWRQLQWERNHPGEEYPGEAAMDAYTAQANAQNKAEEQEELRQKFPYLF